MNLKKTLALAALTVLGGSAMQAQTSLVKQAEGEFKKADNYAKYQAALNLLTPAFENPETAKQANTYFVPGKAGFDVYDNYFKMRQLGQQVNLDEQRNALLAGYDFLLKALPLDSLPDEKGKVKPKYSGKIVDIIAGHANDFDQMAVSCYQAQDYMGAYNAWGAFCDITTDPRYSKKVNSFPDSVISGVRMNQGIMAMQAQEYKKAADAFMQAVALGSNNPMVYEYAYTAAYQDKNKDLMKQISKMGYEKFGSSHPVFLQRMVNDYISEEKFDDASKLLSDAIAADPNNAAYYFSLAVLDESRKNRDEAKAHYTKSIELNHQDLAAMKAKIGPKPGNDASDAEIDAWQDAQNTLRQGEATLANSLINMGRMLAEDYDALDQAAGNMSQAEYNKYAHETLFPILKKAAVLFEEAYEVYPDSTDSLLYLKNIYYQLNDTPNYERVKSLLGQ